MKLIIFQYESCLSSSTGYRDSVKMGYLLNAKVALAGVCQREYLMGDLAVGFSNELKSDIILMYAFGEEVRKNVCGLILQRRSIGKMRNKTGRDMVRLARVKKQVDELFDMTVMKHYNANVYGLKTMKELLDREHLYFYPNANDGGDKAAIVESHTILTLNLPDPETGVPLFFVNLNGENGYDAGVDIVASDDELAEDLSCIYGMESFVFPHTYGLSANETRLARGQLEVVTGEFREKIAEWAAVCYANPNSNAGLEHFRAKLQGYLPGLSDRAEESPILRNIAELTRHGNKGKLIVGEAPIDRIWAIYRDCETIDAEEYDRLMSMKKQQYPKYEGRWPVLFYDLAEDVGKGAEIGVRKMIAVD